MSRRSRRRRKSSSIGRWLRWAGGLLVFLLLVGMLGGYGWLRMWLHSEDFRHLLSERTSRALEADANFGAFHWDGTEVRSDSFEARGDGVVREVEARGLELDIGLGRIREQVVELRAVRLRELSLVLDPRREDGPVPAAPVPAVVTIPEPPETPVKSRPWYAGWLPNRVELTGLTIERSSLEVRLDDGPIGFSGTRWVVEPAGAEGAYAITARGGDVSFPWDPVPELVLGEARLRYQDERISVTDSSFRMYERGVLSLAGEVDFDGGFALDGSVRDVMLAEVLPEDWRQRLTGNVAGDFSVVDEGEGVVVRGEVELPDAVLTGLPLLDALGAYGGNPRLRRLVLSEARADFRWSEDGWEVFDLVLASDGLLRVTGGFRAGADDSLDGQLRVGLTPGTLALIPGAETKVFLPGEGGMLWTTVQLGGTVDDPEEDLSERLIAAAGLRMLEVLPGTGQLVLKYTERIVGDDLARHVDRGKDLIKMGEDLVDRGEAIFDGEGDPVDEAKEVLREADSVISGLGGLLDAIRGREPPEEEPGGAE